MSKVADQLRQAREARKLTVHEVANITKIRTDHIRALDEGNYDMFSAPVYIRGFVRTYAGFLKLDVPKLIAELNEELSKSEKHREKEISSDYRKSIIDWVMLLLSKINWKIFLPALAIVLLLVGSVFGYRAWVAAKNHNPLSELGPGFYEPQQRPAGDVLPLPLPQKR